MVFFNNIYLFCLYDSYLRSNLCFSKIFFGKKNRNVKEFVLLVLKYVLYAMVAVCLSFPIIVPAIYALLNAIKTSSAQTDILPRISQVLNGFRVW